MNEPVKYINEGNLLLSGRIRNRIDFNNSRIFSFTTSNYYERIDSHSIDPNSYSLGNLYELDGILMIHFPYTDNFTFVRDVDIIESAIVGEFESFKYGRVFELSNGQIWEQTDSLETMNLDSNKDVIIYNNSQIKVANWTFFPTVRRIK